MKLICFGLFLTSISTFSYGQDCQRVAKKSLESYGEAYVFANPIIINAQNGEGISIDGQFTNDLLALTFLSLGSDECAVEGAPITIIFSDSSTINSQNQFVSNCNRKSAIIFGERLNTLSSIDALKSTPVESIKVTMASRTVVASLNNRQSQDLQTIISCITEHYSELINPIDTLTLKHDNRIFTVVEQQPVFTGGYEALMDYVRNSMRSKKIVRNINGTVYVQFVVEKDGSIGEAKVIRGLAPEADTLALETVQKMPPWQPGRQHGTPVRVRFVLPIKF